MLKPSSQLLTLSLSLIAAQITFAAPAEHTIVAPDCLLKNISSPYQKLAGQNTLSLITINASEIDKLAEAKNRKTLCGGFIDVTQEWASYQPKSLNVSKKALSFLNAYGKQHQSLRTAATIEAPIRFEAEVQQLFARMNPSLMWSDLTTLTNYQDRYANSDTGVQAANWLKSTVETMAKANGRNDVTAYLVKTGAQYKQPSVVVKVGTSNEPGVVIGAHMDTLNGSFGKKPGADDDGSGSVTVLATARTILESGMTFSKPIYFIWYAAEEEGLVGSGYVVKDFKSKNIPVKSVLHFDLTGYAYRNESTMWLIDDFVNRDLVNYLETLINTYVKKPVKHTKCGYACSDHASWTQQGYPAAIPAESAYENTNPDIHSSRDTMANLSLDHMTDYLKLALAFAVESAEPTN